MITYETMNISHYQDVISLMTNDNGIILRDSDSKKQLEFFLNKNKGLSFIAKDEDKIVGAVFCGHDGRRGYLNHLFVAPEYRRKNIGKKLVDLCIEKLKEFNIYKTHIFVQKDNESGVKFWESLGWFKRDEFYTMSFISNDSENA